MMKKVMLVFISITVIIGYGFTRSGLKTTPLEKTEKVELSVTGEMLYQKNCAACHGINRKGNPPTFPSLVDIDKQWRIYMLNPVHRWGWDAGSIAGT